MIKCTTCGTTEDILKNKWSCRKCYNAIHVERMTLRRKIWKDWLVQNANMVCERCGYNEFLSAIDFHHIDPATKDFAIGNWTNGRFAFNKKNQKLVLQEIKKCKILCANCHRGLHSKHKENK